MPDKRQIPRTRKDDVAVSMGNTGFRVAVNKNYRRVRRCESCLRRDKPLHHMILPKATMRYPETQARVRSQEHWLCDECYEKLRAAMENEGEEKRVGQ